MKVGIVIPVINHVDMTLAAVASIQSQYETYTVIVDNGSTDGTREAFAYMTTGRYIDNGENKGLTIAWNQGVSACFEAGCNYILLANNDIVLHPKTIDNLVETLEQHPDWGMATGVNDKGWADEHGGPQAIGQKEIAAVESVRPHPDFSCFMVRASIFDQLRRFELKHSPMDPNPGFFDEEFSRRGKAFYEDNDLHFRLHRAGIPAFCTDRAPYYHYASVTAGSTGITSGINRDYFVEKWGGSPQEVFPH